MFSLTRRKMTSTAPPSRTFTAHRGRPLGVPLPLPPPPPPDADLIGSLPTSKLLPSSRRSSSSSSSHSSASDIDSLLSPTTPLRLSSSAAAVPFSWEKIPGLPKTPILNRTHSSPGNFTTSQLPLPPMVPTGNDHKQRDREHRRKAPVSGRRSQRDPFLAALMECSKDERDGVNKVAWKGSRQQQQVRSTRQSSTDHERMFGVMVGYSCKRACSVAESIVFMPGTRRIYHNVIKKRSSLG